MAVFLGAVNIVLDEYAKGAMKTAVDDAAEAGAALGGSTAACETVGASVKSELLPGPFGTGVVITCRVRGSTVVASAAGPLPSLLPAVPEWSLSVVGLSVLEHAPVQ
jgi:hypothetical protein